MKGILISTSLLKIVPVLSSLMQEALSLPCVKKIDPTLSQKVEIELTGVNWGICCNICMLLFEICAKTESPYDDPI